MRNHAHVRLPPEGWHERSASNGGAPGITPSRQHHEEPTRSDENATPPEYSGTLSGEQSCRTDGASDLHHAEPVPLSGRSCTLAEAPGRGCWAKASLAPRWRGGVGIQQSALGQRRALRKANAQEDRCRPRPRPYSLFTRFAPRCVAHVGRARDGASCARAPRRSRRRAGLGSRFEHPPGRARLALRVIRPGGGRFATARAKGKGLVHGDDVRPAAAV